MGAHQSAPAGGGGKGPRRDQLDRETTAKLFSLSEGIKTSRALKSAHGCCLSGFSIFKADAEAKAAWAALQQKLLLQQEGSRQLTAQQDRAIGVLLGLVCGDALGAPLEFLSVQYGIQETKGLTDEKVWQVGYGKGNRFHMQMGQWTDDASMALCLADSLLVNRGLNMRDLRLRFNHWWTFGYNNAFFRDQFHPGSVGLGGNISQSLREFIESNGTSTRTTAGNKATSGNGSLMRLGPVSIFYAGDRKQAMKVAYEQSLSTHQGEEAAECCRLLAFVCVTAQGLGDQALDKAFLETLHERFESPLYSVTCLARSEAEKDHEENARLPTTLPFHKGLQDRNWNWRSADYKYSPSRATSQPGYVGSYSMDCLSMALHCVWSTSSLEAALLKAANLRGDADTVSAVTGQIAGSIYGASAIPQSWLKQVQRWDEGGRIAFTASCLFSKSFQHVEDIPSFRSSVYNTEEPQQKPPSAAVASSGASQPSGEPSESSKPAAVSPANPSERMQAGADAADETKSPES